MNHQSDRLEYFVTTLMEKHDVSKTGSLSVEEIRPALNSMAKWNGVEEGSEEERKEFFNWLDSNQDGKVTLEDFRGGMRELMYDHFETEKNYKEMMNFLSLEYKKIYEDQEARFEYFMTTLMEKHDVSKTGSLSVEEIRPALNSMAKWNGVEEGSEEQNKKFFHTLDSNHDGKVSLEEFSTAMREGMYHVFESEKSYKELMNFLSLEYKKFDEVQEARFVDFTTKFMEKHNVSKTGSLSEEELIESMKSNAKKQGGGDPQEDVAIELFRVLNGFANFDLNQDGKVTLEELSTVFRKDHYKECDSEKRYKMLMAEHGLDI